MAKLKGKAVVAQSGGPTAAINASAAGVIQTALKNDSVFTGVYGSLNGILGVLNEELFDLAQEDPAQIDLLRKTPSAALGSCRHKLKDLDKDRADYERILEVFKAHDIRYFFYIGGNDSMDTADKLASLARRDPLRDDRHGRAQDHRQRPGLHRPLPRLRLGGQVHRHQRDGGRARHRGPVHRTTPARSRRSWAATPAGSPPPPGWRGGWRRTPRT